MTRTYYVRDFNLTDMLGFPLLLSDFTAVRIDNPAARRLLETLTNSTLTYINETILLDICKREDLPFVHTINFLTNEARILIDVSKIVGEHSKFKMVKILCDCPESSEKWVEYLRRDGVPNTTILDTREPIGDSIENNENCLFVTLQKDYEPNLIRKVYSRLRDDSSNGVITSYVYGDQFWIDGLYIKNVGLPSHFSHMARWRALEQSTNSTSGWLGLMDKFFAQQITFQNPYRPPQVEIDQASFHLLKKIIEFAGVTRSPSHLNDMLRAIRVDLPTGTCSSEIVARGYLEEDCCLGSMSQ